MRYKSDSGTTLDSMNRDIGVVNKIFIDNALKQNGYNTEIQIVARLATIKV